MNLVLGDCLDEMKNIDDKSIDMVLCDLPYGTTNCAWDVVIPFDKLWEQYNRIIKDNGAIVLFAAEPFSSILVCSNLEMFKYQWVWNKINKFSGHLNCKKQPLRQTERICVFSKNQTKYYPQMDKGIAYKAISSGTKSKNYREQKNNIVTENTGTRYPKDILNIEGDERGTVGRIHPTQKPVLLLEYLIKTYTDEGDIILDNTMGSGSTGVACVNTGRNFIGMEKEKDYFVIAKNRIDEAKKKIIKTKNLKKFVKGQNG
jgi:site-specific DNA-methyltransferase (adenine-specific)